MITMHYTWWHSAKMCDQPFHTKRDLSGRDKVEVASEKVGHEWLARWNGGLAGICWQYTLDRFEAPPPRPPRAVDAITAIVLPEPLSTDLVLIQNLIRTNYVKYRAGVYTADQWRDFIRLLNLTVRD